MRFSYCPDCGCRLSRKELGDEGLIPWCDQCQKPFFDMFSSCVIVLVVNEQEEGLLLRQQYLSDRYHNLVSGYMKPGESAEDCACREVLEETGIPMQSLKIIGTYWFARKEQLMIGFIGRAQKAPFRLSREVDGAQWVPIEKALAMVHPKGSVSYALIEYYLTETRSSGTEGN